MPPLCSSLDQDLPLISAHKHVRLTSVVPPHQIGVPRGSAPGRGCMGRGRPLPPPAQGACIEYEWRGQGLSPHSRWAGLWPRNGQEYTPYYTFQ